MSNTLINVENVSKKFCRSLKRSLWYGVKDLGAELTGHRSNHKELRKDEFWAIKNVSLKLARGESIAFIGHNGAGKTTLLRMLNGLIKPDRGHIEIRGRVQALIALGAGFNPILTGRENVYVNASVLGIKKAEVDRRFDEIVDFAGIEEFIDTPVQNYSSGMTVRLGFAVAAHMNPDILLVDEVLAVGDLNFQAKCRKRIQDLLAKGVAIVLVSHNLHPIRYLCPRSLVFDQGKIIFSGETNEAIDIYRASLLERNGGIEQRGGTGEIRIKKCEFLNEHGLSTDKFTVGDSASLRIHYAAREPVVDPVVNVIINGSDGNQITGLRTDIDNVSLGKLTGEGYLDVNIPSLNLLPNIYLITVAIFHSDGYAFYDRIEEVAQLTVLGGLQVNGTTYLPHFWNSGNHVPETDDKLYLKG